MHNNIPDENILQSYPASCAIKCQQIILRDYGIDVSEDDLCRIAKENRWYDENVGVFMHDNGKLLGCFGVTYHHSQNNTIDMLCSELSKGHRIMVNVSLPRLEGCYISGCGASHAIIVTSVESDAVSIINPSKGIMDEKIGRDIFYTAWKDSAFYMLSTNEHVMYKYSSGMHSMIKL